MAQAVRLSVTVHVNMCYFSSTLFFLFFSQRHAVFPVRRQNALV